jgi:hypothetical protein
MTCDVAVTFEYALRPPQTVRITAMTAVRPHTIAVKALKIARSRAKPVGWTSISILLDRQDAPEEISPTDAQTEG